MQSATAPAPCSSGGFWEGGGGWESSSGSTGRGWGCCLLCQGHAQDQGRGTKAGREGHPWHQRRGGCFPQGGTAWPGMAPTEPQLWVSEHQSAGTGDIPGNAPSIHSLLQGWHLLCPWQLLCCTGWCPGPVSPCPRCPHPSSRPWGSQGMCLLFEALESAWMWESRLQIFPVQMDKVP